MASKKILTEKETKEFLDVLQERFEKNKNRHQNIDWNKIQEKLVKSLGKLWSLHQMESSGGEPDVVKYDKEKDEFTFFDCSKESPAGRRSFCYDRNALDSRKQNKPANDVSSAASEMGIEILNEEQYYFLQTLGEFDLKTSSWIKTPENIRKLGGALFCDRRYDTVFTYHNGADSYYAARGFRGFLVI
ncbi:hypothetical protein ASG01_10045 [Chryseobacterium sp. Leaf180]|uniref:DUF4256 domain-containing protein n=1 Tax=Chryseobacterium sp. Leaf180 TaxID=1736289 RepID=UPI0006FE30AF|nr:DUF4256 domain-containing protein [Chryseobacterium sp. Leaf180]KQR93506.1 hypothetical protein ASG01_10045 [Chryseobacterium sp. Leaf180]